MATIVNNPKYGEGHGVVFKDKLPAARIKQLRDLKYTPLKDVFKITKNRKFQPQIIIQAGTGKDFVNLIDEKKRTITVVGSASGINGLFNHAGKSGKANTNLLTEIKEMFSLVMFQAATENSKLLTEEEAINKVAATIPQLRDNYQTVYYESAFKQLKEYKKYAKGRGYSYERQGEDKTKQLYKVARSLTGKLNDNWNPADVWAIRKTYDMDILYQSKTAEMLNLNLVEAFNNKDILPISLKQVEKPTAKSSVVDPARLYTQKLDLNLSYDQTDLSDTYKNFILKTKSGFAIRAGYKASATTLNVSLEGRFLGAGYQTGAVDAKLYTNYVREQYGYSLRSSAVVPGDYVIAQEELKEIYRKKHRLSNTIKDYDHAIELFERADKLTQDRFANIVSYLYSFLILPTNFEEHMKFAYLSSKKISSDSSLYLLIEQS